MSLPLGEVKTSGAVSCWRLIHDGSDVLGLFESEGITKTKRELLCGTENECNNEISRLSLSETEYDAETD